MYVVVLLILDASMVVGAFGPFIQTFALAASAGGKVLALIDRPQEPINTYSTNGLPVSIETMKNDIVFQDVSFLYPARPTTRILDSVNLRFKPGTMTGIVGLSGSGKSTIASLLLRLYDPTSGTITLGEDDLKTFNIKSWRSQLALVDQDPVLFSGTILQNISDGILDKARMSQEEILQRCIRAAAEANADFIDLLPGGIHTKIGGSRGSQLSGGQRQRICLARALVRRPALLLLDEPTSALDAISEALILQALSDFSKTGCTVIMIAHRLATIRNADNILVMGQGSLLEEGTNDQLIQSGGTYKKLVEAQTLEVGGGISNGSSDLRKSTSDASQSPKISFNRGACCLSETLKDDDESTHHSRSAIELLRRCLSLSKPERPLICLGVCASILSGALIVGEAVVFGHLINLLNTQTRSATFQSNVNFFCIMWFVMALVALFAYSISGTAFGLASEHLVNRIRNTSLRTILQQDIGWFSQPDHSSHALTASINTDSGRLSALSGVNIGTLCSVTTSMVGGIILAHIVAWKIAIVLLAAVPVMVLAGFLRLRVLARSQKRHETAYNAAAALASEACQGMRMVAAFGREQDVLQQYREAIQKPYDQSFKSILVGSMTFAFSLAITYFVYSLAYWW